MKTENIRLLYITFGIFFLIIGIAIFGISNVVGNEYTPWNYYDPTFYLATIGLALMAASFLFIVLTLHFFRDEFLEKNDNQMKGKSEQRLKT